MENKIIKPTSLILLAIIWGLFYFTHNKDLILLYFLLLINGLLISNKDDVIKISIIILFYLTVNIFQGIKEGQIINSILFISILFSANFLLPLIAGKLFANFFKNKSNSLWVTKIWLFTFILGLLAVTFINKDFISDYPYLVIAIFSIMFFLAGAYINTFSNTNMNLILFIIFPLKLIPIIFFTTEKNAIEPIIADLSIIFSSTVGFFSYKLYKKEKKIA